VNFDFLEKILEHSLVDNLKVPMKDTPLLFTENAVHNKELRRKLTEYMFESQEIPALFICKDAVLSSFACGRSTSLVLDSGMNRTTATPVNDGYALQKCLMQVGVGGDTLTD
jgi:actin-related protein